jgi:hypothetical protein
MRTGITNLPLHGGKAPYWLFEKMERLSREIMLFFTKNGKKWAVVQQGKNQKIRSSELKTLDCT